MIHGTYDASAEGAWKTDWLARYGLNLLEKLLLRLLQYEGEYYDRANDETVWLRRAIPPCSPMKARLRFPQGLSLPGRPLPGLLVVDPQNLLPTEGHPSGSNQYSFFAAIVGKHGTEPEGVCCICRTPSR